MRAYFSYRIVVVSLTIPPLRERQEDVELLANYFLEHVARRYEILIPSLGSEDTQALYDYAWPGNVRELRNVIELAVLLSPMGEFSLHLYLAKNPAVSHPLVAKTDEAAEQGKCFRPPLKELQVEYLIWALNKTGWKINGSDGAARLLSLKISTLYKKIKNLNLR